MLMNAMEFDDLSGNFLFKKNNYLPWSVILLVQNGLNILEFLASLSRFKFTAVTIQILVLFCQLLYYAQAHSVMKRSQCEKWKVFTENSSHPLKNFRVSHGDEKYHSGLMPNGHNSTKQFIGFSVDFYWCVIARIR